MIPRLRATPVASPNPYPPISGWRWLATNGKPTAGGAFHVPYILALRANPRQIAGAAGITMTDRGVPEIGYWVAKSYRRRGFAAEAARALIDLAFHESDANDVGAYRRTTNIASQRVLFGAGMRRIGRGRIKSAQLGRYVPTFIYQLDRASWEKARKLASQ